MMWNYLSYQTNQSNGISRSLPRYWRVLIRDTNLPEHSTCTRGSSAIRDGLSDPTRPAGTPNPTHDVTPRNRPCLIRPAIVRYPSPLKVEYRPSILASAVVPLVDLPQRLRRMSIWCLGGNPHHCHMRTPKNFTKDDRVPTSSSA